jgi:antitoxin HicB
LPEALTGSSSVEEALHEAPDCLGEALAGRLERREPIPRPSPARRGCYSIPVPLTPAPQPALYQAMRRRKIDNLELAARMGCSEMIVRRLLNPRTNTRPDRLQQALEKLGMRLVVSVEDAA